jgi:putative ABC transport system permease protein
VAALHEIRAEVLGAPKEAAYQLVATSEDYHQVKNLTIAQGRFLCHQDQLRKNQVCVLGWDISQELGSQGRLGSNLRIGDFIFKVAGILERRHWSKPKVAVLASRNYNECIFLPLSAARVFGGDPGVTIPVSEISVQFKGSREVITSSRIIESVLSRLHHGVEDYQLIIPQELIREAQQTQKIFNIVLGGIAGISLLVGGIGIMNIMLATVSERTREIGIRRAVGANQKHIVMQFLAEAGILTVSGGLIGTLLGCAASVLISILAGWETMVTGWAIFLSLGMALAVGIFFGFYPAYRAAKLDPIQALRYE